MVFAEKCFEEYQKSVCIYTHRRLSVGKADKFSLTECGEGAFGSCFVSPVRGLPSHAFAALQPLAWSVTLTCQVQWAGVPHIALKSMWHAAWRYSSYLSWSSMFAASCHVTSCKLLTHLEEQTFKRSDEKFAIDLHRGTLKAI